MEVVRHGELAAVLKAAFTNMGTPERARRAQQRPSVSQTPKERRDATMA